MTYQDNTKNMSDDLKTILKDFKPEGPEGPEEEEVAEGPEVPEEEEVDLNLFMIMALGSTRIL